MTIKLITRAQWGARPRGSGGATPFDPRGVALHWEGAGWSWPWSHATCDDKVRSIQAYHMDGKGWSDIAYSFLACPHGYVFEGRGLNRRSAANGDYGSNTYWYAVQCMWGSRSGNAPAALLEAARDAIDYCRSAGGAGDALRGHRDFKSTDCPGDELYAWVRGGATRPSQPGEDMNTDQYLQIMKFLITISGNLAALMTRELSDDAAKTAQIVDLRNAVAEASAKLDELAPKA